ncbi:MAG: hypothetical protein AAF714_10310 [Pseudomonadota bacterium]
MVDLTQNWEALTKRWIGHQGVSSGTMMRRPALTLGGHTLVFLAKLHGPGMGAKIGSLDPAEIGLTDWRPLQPFKDKAPMRGWIIVGPGDVALWDEIVKAALTAARTKADA